MKTAKKRLPKATATPWTAKANHHKNLLPYYSRFLQLMQVRFFAALAKKKLKIRISKKSVKYRLNGLIRVLTNGKKLLL